MRGQAFLLSGLLIALMTLSGCNQNAQTALPNEPGGVGTDNVPTNDATHSLNTSDSSNTLQAPDQPGQSATQGTTPNRTSGYVSGQQDNDGLGAYGSSTDTSIQSSGDSDTAPAQTGGSGTSER